MCVCMCASVCARMHVCVCVSVLSFLFPRLSTGHSLKFQNARTGKNLAGKMSHGLYTSESNWLLYLRALNKLTCEGPQREISSASCREMLLISPRGVIGQVLGMSSRRRERGMQGAAGWACWVVSHGPFQAFTLQHSHAGPPPSIMRLSAGTKQHVSLPLHGADSSQFAHNPSS